MQRRHSDRNQYFEEQDITTRHHVVPFIDKFRHVVPGMTVLEIGCGEGGNLKAFLDLGCKVTGIDLSGYKINLARQFFKDHHNLDHLELIAEDIYNLPPPAQKYDIVIMRDVIEHIHDQNRFMHFVRPFMLSESLFFLAYPPWQNPFGGHQQICRNKFLGRMPWIHLLPETLYRRLLKSTGESPATIENLLEVKETGISIEKFEEIIKDANFRIVSKVFYLVNPNYEVKFGLKPVRQCRLISGIPRFRNFFTTSVYYLLAPNQL